MLETNMREATAGRIVVEDVGLETIENMLNFVYKGTLNHSTDSLSDDMLIELLYCADKYDVVELKVESLRRMQSKLSMENAMKFAKAAKSFRADEEILNSMFHFCKR